MLPSISSLLRHSVRRLRNPAGRSGRQRSCEGRSALEDPSSEVANGQWKRQGAGIGIVTLIAAPLIIAGAGYALVLPAFSPDKSTPASRYHDASLDIDTDPPQPWVARAPQEWLELERLREQKGVQP